MELDVMPKPKRPTPPAASSSGDDDVTSYKCYKRIAKILRKIGAFEDANQEDTLALFEDTFENYLALLIARDLDARKKRSAE